MSWSEAWEWFIDRWESDSVFQTQIMLALMVGAIGFAWAILEAGAVTRIQTGGER